ncbi:Rrf2 family transcriptional regulator [Rhodobacteraceae bacterium (ex Bugula neritina AB1)]|nr:Rrf2 family transcriptional regulator [Rhodobacteraceae bacterium (ex Bugula neritina AB1)]
MKRNSRLSLALHTLSHMAGEPDRMRTSSDIAEHARTNPVVVRRVLGKLREAGLLTSEKGHSGGWQLAKPASNITLADIYLALDERLVSAGNKDAEPSHCTVESGLQTRVGEVLDEIENSLVARLSETTIADVHPASCSYCGSK